MMAKADQDPKSGGLENGKSDIPRFSFDRGSAQLPFQPGPSPLRRYPSARLRFGVRRRHEHVDCPDSWCGLPAITPWCYSFWEPQVVRVSEACCVASMMSPAILPKAARKVGQIVVGMPWLRPVAIQERTVWTRRGHIVNPAVLLEKTAFGLLETALPRQRHSITAAPSKINGGV